MPEFSGNVVFLPQAKQAWVRFNCFGYFCHLCQVRQQCTNKHLCYPIPLGHNLEAHALFTTYAMYHLYQACNLQDSFGKYTRFFKVFVGSPSEPHKQLLALTHR